ncbi:MAG: MBL fold metallo-hydrolase [Candidatus Hydrogenedentota bacterium]
MITTTRTIRFSLVATLTLFMSTLANAQLSNSGRSTPKVPDTGLHAILLGTGIPLPNPERATASTLIVAGGRTFMVDTGFNSVSRLNENGYQRVDHVLFTHFHIDHYGDLDRLLFSRGGGGAESVPLSVLGPKGTKAVIHKVVASVAIDEKYRLEHHGEHWSPKAMQATTQEFEPGVIFDEDGIKVTMFLVDHEPIEVAVGYRFEYEGKSIVVSGDTKRSESLIEAAKDCDLLIHEAMNGTVLNAVLPALKRGNPRGGAMLEDLMEVHTSTLDVAEIAKLTNAKKLVLTHLVPSIAPEDAQEKNFVRGMSDIYPGPITVGRDNMIFTVE